MKNLLILLMLLMLSSITSKGQSIKHISLSFNPNDFELKHDQSDNTYITSKQHHFFLKSDTLLPALPYMGFNVLVKNNELFSSLSFSCRKTHVQSNVTMAPNPIPIPTDMLPSNNGSNVSVSYNQEIYPQTYMEFAGMNEGDGYRLLSFHVCPFEYDAVTRKLYLRTTIDVDIYLDSSSPVLPSSKNQGRRSALKDMIRKNIINPEDLDNWEESSFRSFSSDSLTKQTGYEYVIVTSNNYKDTFQELANWKSRKGIRAKVLTVEDIDTTYTGATKQERIKRALADIDGLEYVLLAGTTNKVPTCMCYIGSEEGTTPADAYYACLGTMNWDRDGNGLYGELRDTVCLLPSLVVSRVRPSIMDDAQAFINRIINYESSPDTTNWHSDILMAGNSIGHIDNYGYWHPYIDSITGFSDTQIWSQMLYDTYIAPSGTNHPSWDGERTRFYDTYTDMSHDGTYAFSAPHLQTELAKGYTFVDIMTHGNRYDWQMETSGSYSSQTADTLHNSGYTIITTTACHTNAFDYSSGCLSDHFIRNPQSGVLAYWGASRKNWGSPRLFDYLENGDLFDGLTYRKLLEDRYHRMGKATMEVKFDQMDEASNTHNNLDYYSTERMVWMGLNLMGDPEMPVYLEKPKYFHDVNIQFVNDSIYVDAGTSDFDICFINQNDSTDYYIAREIPNSVVAFKRLNGMFDVCITKPGYVPYFTTCGDTYLQNITLSGTKTYKAKQAMIGSNVTNKVAQGPVVVSSGSTTIKVSQGATITKDFEVKQGAEFIITNQ